MNAMTVIKRYVMIGALAAVLTACGKIPSAYQGSFVDRASGARLELGSSDGTLTTADGRVLKAEASSSDPKALSEGKPGIYVRASEADKDDLEIFWVNPVLASLKSESGFVYMESEILYTRMNAKASDSVGTIQLRYCRNGQLAVDIPTMTFNGGCPADSRLMAFERK